MTVDGMTIAASRYDPGETIQRAVSAITARGMVRAGADRSRGRGDFRRSLTGTDRSRDF